MRRNHSKYQNYGDNYSITQVNLTRVRFQHFNSIKLSVLLLFLGLNYEYVVIFKHYLLLSPHKDWLQAGPPMHLKASEVQAVTDFSSSQNIRDRTA